MADLTAKVVLLGSQGVGKTSLMLRCSGQEFDTHISPTIGASFSRCIVKVSGKPVLLQIWDTAGQERFRSMAPMYYRNADAAVIVFDLTSGITFEDCKSWIEEFRGSVDNPSAFVFLVGNKSDLDTPPKEVDSQEARIYAQKIGAHYYETSALHNKGVEEAFRRLAEIVLEQSVNEKFKGLTESDTVDVTKLPSQRRCC